MLGPAKAAVISVDLQRILNHVGSLALAIERSGTDPEHDQQSNPDTLTCGETA
jgi:hypothetical protein